MLLKKSTAYTVSVGPCLDASGVEYTGLVIGDLTITKNGISAAMAAAATLTATSNGFYDLVLTTGNTDTVGYGKIRCNKAGYQIPPVEFEVRLATTFDALVTNAAGAANGLFIAGTNAATTGVPMPSVTEYLPAVVRNSTSNLIRVFLRNSTTGQIKTAMTFNSPGLIISLSSEADSLGVPFYSKYSQAAGTIETIAAPGVYAAPTAGKVRFAQYVNDSYEVQFYEIQFANSLFASLGKSMRLNVYGVSGMSEYHAIFPLVDASPYVANLDAAGVRSAVGLASANLDTQLAAIQADLPTRITKNVALANFPFLMILASDDITPATGLTVTATRSIDGAAFASCANAVTEISSGWYKISLAASDLNGDTIALRFTAATANDRNITIVTQAT